MEHEQPSVKGNGISKKEKYVFHTLERNKNNNQLIKSTMLVVLGTIIYCFGVVWILQLGGFFSGGVTGASQLIVGLIEKFGGPKSIRGYLGVFVGLINLPLLIVGYRGVSKHFVILTIISIVLQTVLISIIANLSISPFIYFWRRRIGFVVFPLKQQLSRHRNTKKIKSMVCNFCKHFVHIP